MDLKTLRKDLRHDPTGQWIYTVGSINGDMDLLHKIVEEIENSGFLAQEDKIVFLGNYIGETGDSKQILNYLRDYQNLRSNQVVLLRGAKEQNMLISRRSFFISKLGKNTMKSYRECRNTVTPHNMLNAEAFVKDRHWLQSLPTYHITDKYFFVHSGVNPNVSLFKQIPSSLMFIKDQFYKSDVNFGRLIIHATDKTSPVIKSNRIGLAQSDEKRIQYMVFNNKNSEPSKLIEATVSLKRD